MGKYLDALRTGLLAVLLAAGGMTALSMTGCEREEGPVEETTETIEETGEEAGEGVEEAGERARDAVD
ncbi:MAG: hypothetical protein GX591_03705 [Planctomycetes bacterium]|nr:hypothetical protein [Planctomycetota bacterium]